MYLNFPHDICCSPLHQSQFLLLPFSFATSPINAGKRHILERDEATDSGFISLKMATEEWGWQLRLLPGNRLEEAFGREHS